MFKNERLQYLTLQTKIPDKIRMILFYAVIKDCNWHTQTWVGKTKSKDWRVVYLSHLSSLSSNSKTARTEVLTSDSQVPSTFHHHVQVVTSDEVRIMVMKMIMAIEMVMRQKTILILDLFKYHMSSHIGSFTSDHGWKKNTSSKRVLCQFFLFSKIFQQRCRKALFKISYICGVVAAATSFKPRLDLENFWKAISLLHLDKFCWIWKCHLSHIFCSKSSPWFTLLLLKFFLLD